MMKKVLMLVALAVMSFSVMAEGGKNKNPWQTGDEEIPTAYLPLGLELEDCDLISETATANIYECDGGKVFGVFTVSEPK